VIKMLVDSNCSTWKQDRGMLQHQKGNSVEDIVRRLLCRLQKLVAKCGSIFGSPCKLGELKDRFGIRVTLSWIGDEEVDDGEDPSDLMKETSQRYCQYV
jgi:hypothetical protein